jgi:hypothetical protein
MAVRDVDDDDIDAGLDEFGGAFEVIALRADRRTDTQPALRVSRGTRQLPLMEKA